MYHSPQNTYVQLYSTDLTFPIWKFKKCFLKEFFKQYILSLNLNHSENWVRNRVECLSKLARLVLYGQEEEEEEEGVAIVAMGLSPCHSRSPNGHRVTNGGKLQVQVRTMYDYHVPRNRGKRRH